MSSVEGRVPAWKRLGLKLKAAPESQTETSLSQTASAVNGAHKSTAPAASSRDNLSAPTKRKVSGAPTPDHSAKKLRREDTNTPVKPKTPKAVSFAAEPEVLNLPVAAANGQRVPKRQKQKKQDKIPNLNPTPKGTAPNAAKPLVKKQNGVASLNSALDYLRQWHSARDSWKFNKNHQTRLLEYIFSDDTTIPAVDINLLYEYIKPLKGFVRKRLRSTAQEVIKKDMEQGAEAFVASNKEVAERKQKEYEESIASFLKEGRTPEKRRFEEVEYVLRTADMEMQRRVVKRMRAEMVIDELPESEDYDMTSSTATGTDVESENTSGETSREGGPGTADGDKRVKLNDGTQRRIRRSKVRTAEVEDDTSSSSEDESESESETSSNGSDSSSGDSDSDDAMEVEQTRNEAETSSSSSSSSSEAESGSDDSSDDEV